MSDTPTDKSEFVSQTLSKLDPLILDKICRPVLERLPESIHPNTLSLSNTMICWIVVWLAILSPRGGAVGQPLMLVLAGIGMFISMLLDNLDGMQARRTNRCSKLGEMLDHWLDAIHVPLANVGMAMALQLPPWGIVGVVLSGTMVYNAQVLLYHEDRVFIHPATSGTDAQVGLSIGFVLVAVVFSLVPRENYWVSLLVALAAGYATLRQLWLTAFFYPKLGRRVLPHVGFAAICCAWGALHLLGAIDAIAFVLLVTFISFRISGTYIQRAILHQPYSGNDWTLVAWTALAAAAFALTQAARLGLALPPLLVDAATAGLPYLPYAVMVHLVTCNLVAFVADFRELRPRAAG